jgi:ABC-2 type transport system permease protein
METTLDLSRWRQPPRGVAYRRWVIVATGLRLLFRMRFFKVLLAAAWLGGSLIALAGFVFSQSVASGGWLETLGVHLGPRAEALMRVLGGFVVLYPDICVRGVFTVVFWAHSFVGLWLTLLAMTVMVPRLITHDRASNALTVYLSRPLTTVDYLLGKLGMIVGVIVLVWTGPLLVGWLLSMAFATDRDFLVYSLLPLGRALLFNGIGLVAIAAIALGVSTVSRTSRNTIILWIGLWLIFGFVASPPGAPHWIQRASFTHDLGQVRQKVLQLDAALADASVNLPFLDQQFARNLASASTKAEASDFPGALAALGIFVALSSAVFFRKLRPE